MVFHGKGGYDWDTVYNMPRWLRLFVYNKIHEFYEKEAEAHEAANKGGKSKSTLIDSSGKVNRDAWKNAPAPPSKTKYK